MGFFGAHLFDGHHWSTHQPESPPTIAEPWLLVDIHDSDIATIRYRPIGTGSGTAYLGHTPRTYFENPAARPARTRRHPPLINRACRLLHFGGRPAFFGRDSSGPNAAHCASVRSNRLVTATLATRSPCRWLSWSITHLPETSPHIDHRHTGTGQLTTRS